ncbi:ABC transporter ATP-binding protein [Gluconacetobacter aggeris]|uniref:ABC transporter ATP-binding protein n=1 Tax=Gluconacetobacter aggeris TaxID=1286186 RepID=A0A7W4IVL3_9PROT|nr:ABC transporter ATP-binding protein [Gluconacetobacter aggeris]MBB2169733.1 ABC transporter ATP-binding protein [Gluconacetobacter aggeris]
MTTLLSAQGIEKHFKLGRARKAPILRAVNRVDLDIAKGESVGLVGESGSGKSTLGRCLAGAYQPDLGTLLFDGVDMLRANQEEIRWLRHRIQFVFQNPTSALNPRMTVAETLTEHLHVQAYGSRARIAQRVGRIMDLCGLPRCHADRFPHQLSGGQKQRVLIARALGTEADFIVADEPVSALDGSTRAQIINLFSDLRRDLGLSSLIISHDLTVLAHLSQRIAVMYFGRLVEIAPAATLLRAPRHPYSQILLAAVPVPDPSVERVRTRLAVRGESPDPTEVVRGCPFHSRCPLVGPRCLTDVPPLRTLPDETAVACHNVDV